MFPEPTFPSNRHSGLRQLRLFTRVRLIDERTASLEIRSQTLARARVRAGPPTVHGRSTLLAGLRLQGRGLSYCRRNGQDRPVAAGRPLVHGRSDRLRGRSSQGFFQEVGASRRQPVPARKARVRNDVRTGLLGNARVGELRRYAHGTLREPQRLWGRDCGREPYMARADAYLARGGASGGGLRRRDACS